MWPRLALPLVTVLLCGVGNAAQFSCPLGLEERSGSVPHPWYDDVEIPSKWCVNKTNVRNGPWWGWDPQTGTAVFRVALVNGELHGPYRMFFTTGAVAEEGTWDYGKKKGKWVVYKPDGSVESEETY